MVILRQTLVIKILKHVSDHFHDRQLYVEVGCRFENRVEIFDEIANRCARAKVALDHATTMFLQDAAVAVTT